MLAADGRSVSRVLVVTNDFPPRPGGIQSYVASLVAGLGDVVVYTSRWRGWAAYDATLPFPVVRARTSVLLPTPAVRRRAVALLREHGCDAVWFGAAAPLGLLAPALRAAGARRIVATTHGHETGWALLPGPRALLRRIAAEVDVLSCVSAYTRGRLVPVLGPYAGRLAPLPPGVDTAVFSPAADGQKVRARLGIPADAPVLVCVSRLMPRKGQDTLVRALPAVRAAVPGARLLLVGGGPYRRRLAGLAAGLRVEEAVTFTGSVPAGELPAHYRAGDVFAMPCRTRLGGLDVEGLGIVYLEAAACGLPVVVGRSGGAPETVRHGETGLVVDGESVREVAEALGGLLADRIRSARMGQRGRQWVGGRWSVETGRDRLADWLS